MLVKRRNFAVENRGLRLDGCSQVVQFGILRGEVVLIARHQANFAFGDERNGAVTVPLDFKQPLGIVEGLLDGSGQHGVDRGGHGALEPRPLNL